jgi:hypothetical protein
MNPSYVFEVGTLVFLGKGALVNGLQIEELESLLETA